MHGIYFSANSGKQGFRLPVNPEKVGAVSSGDGETFTISNLGNVNIPKDVKLETYAIETFFPTQDYPFLVASFKEPEYYIQMLKNWQTNKQAIRFMYVNGSFTINELVTIEDFQYAETGGSADVDFSLSLKKYVDFSPKKMEVVKVSTSAATSQNSVFTHQVVKKSAPPRQNEKEEVKTYNLIKGDTLWRVAQKFLGSGSRYPEIQKLNGIKDSQLKSLPIGLKVKLPKK